MSASWSDIESTAKNNAIESLDKSTLEEYSKVEPSQFNNSGIIAQAQHIQQRILRRLAQIEAEERARRDEDRYKKNLLIAVLTLIVAAIAAWPVIREWLRPSPSVPPAQTIQSAPSGSAAPIQQNNQLTRQRQQSSTRKSN